MGGIEVVGPDELGPVETSPGVSRQLVFETENAHVVRSRVAGGVTTGWHHNGDRHVYGYVVEGEAILEYGPEGSEAADLATGSFVHVPPRTIRRVVNPTDDGWVIVLTFVGSGPIAVNVDGPEAASADHRGERRHREER